MNMQQGFDFKKLLPYAAALIIFAVIISIYFLPVLEGKKLSASDMVHFKGMSKEIVDFREKTGEEPLWTNHMFGGMPAYQISTVYYKNLMTHVHEFIRLGFHLPIGMVIVYLVGFYFLLIVLRVNPWLSIAGAIAFAFSSYHFIILEAGHTSKAYAIGYMAPVMAGVILAYRGQLKAGGLITAVALALQILSGHPQITYYLLYCVLFYALAELWVHYREKRLPAFIKASAVLVAAAVLAILTHTASLWNTWEYSKYSLRGKTELTSDQENRTRGLDRDYATAWSYGIPETMTLLIPNFHGGSSHGELSKKSETYQLLVQNRVQNPEQIVKALPLYWGTQPFTSGPVYLGAIVVFLFIFSLFYLKGPFKWWGIAVTLLSIFLAWGKNFPVLTNFFLDYVPLYNKFRAVSMTLVIAELSIPLLAIVALDKFIREPNGANAFKSLKYSFYITGGLIVFFLLFAGSLFSFSSASDDRLPEWLTEAIRADRLSLFRTDAIRSLVFVLLTFGLLWFYMKGKLKTGYLFIALTVLMLADLWPVNKRYLNDDDFVRKSQVDNPYTATVADLAILRDNDPSFRVYNFSESFDASARTSYFHKNIGGYHGAKMRRYQELVDHRLTRERENFAEAFNSGFESVDQAMREATSFNMLNTRYYIINANAEPLDNPYALGNAWFVKDFRIVDNADEEIAALDDFDPAATAIVDRRFAGELQGFVAPGDQDGRIELVSYKPNHLVFEFEASGERLAVFSEIFYDKGWNAYLDGQKVPHFRVNYVLRGMVVPGGTHGIEFRFEPRSYFTGQNVSLIFSAALLVMALAYILMAYLRKPKTTV